LSSMSFFEGISQYSENPEFWAKIVSPP
jgi:hypothetical protein